MSECCCVGMALCWNGVVSEWRCVGMALCRNGVMSFVVFVNGEMSGVEQSDDLRENRFDSKLQLTAFMYTGFLSYMHNVLIE